MGTTRVDRVVGRVRDLIDSGVLSVPHLEAFLERCQEDDEIFSFWSQRLDVESAKSMTSMSLACYRADGSVHACLDTLAQHLAKSVGCWVSSPLSIRMIGPKEFETLMPSRDWVEFFDYLRDFLNPPDKKIPDDIVDVWAPARPPEIEAEPNVYDCSCRKREVAQLLIEPTAELIEFIKPISPERFKDLRDTVFRMLDLLMKHAFLALSKKDADRFYEIEHLVTLIVGNGNIPIGLDKRADSENVLVVLARPKSGRVSSLHAFDE